jgi:hypothetical protein
MHGPKPKAVLRAEYTLWAWTAWLCGFGLYQAFYPDASSRDFLAQLQSVVAIAPDQLRTAMIAVYAVVAVSMVLLVFQIGAGRRWARGGLLLSFVVQALYVAQAGPSEYLTNTPDLIFQAVAVWLLYTDPGRQWFAKERVRKL